MRWMVPAKKLLSTALEQEHYSDSIVGLVSVDITLHGLGCFSPLPCIKATEIVSHYRQAEGRFLGGGKGLVS